MLKRNDQKEKILLVCRHHLLFVSHFHPLPLPSSTCVQGSCSGKSMEVAQQEETNSIIRL